MHIGKIWFIMYCLLPKCFGRYCDHHQGTFTRILIKHNKLLFYISKPTQEVGCGHVDWIGLAQDRDRWRTLVGAVMNLRVP